MTYHRWTTMACRLLFFLLATYGILYFSYKYYVPWLGGDDFARYYSMYLHPLDISQTEAPWIYRQFHALVVHFIYKLGLFYSNQISFVNPNVDQHIFFSALLSNYLGLVFTAFVVSCIVDCTIGGLSVCWPLLGGMFCFLSFFTQQVVITGLSEGWPWFLVALGYYGYVSGRFWVLGIALLVSVGQRETIPILFGSMSAVDLVVLTRQRRKRLFPVLVCLFSIFAFCSYVALRRWLTPVSGYEHQLDIFSMVGHLAAWFPPQKTIIFQGLLSQNIFLLYLGSLMLRAIAERRDSGSKEAYRSWGADNLRACAAFFILMIVSAASGIGENLGRISGVMTPIFAALLVIHLKAIEAGARGADVELSGD